MSKPDVIEKWERISRASLETEQETGESMPLVSVFAKFGSYEEVQLEVPRHALVEARKDIISAGGAYVAAFV